MAATEQNQPTREQLVQLVVQQAALAAEGSFSQRNPTLGKMVKCPFCGRRRRQDQLVCCNPKYIATNLADQPRSSVSKHRKNPRLSRHRPPLFLVHQLLVEKESQENYVEIEGISGIVEAQVMRGRRARTKQKRDQQKLSRRINRER